VISLDNYLLIVI